MTETAEGVSIVSAGWRQGGEAEGCEEARRKVGGSREERMVGQTEGGIEEGERWG